MARPVVFAQGVGGMNADDWFGAVLVYANGRTRTVYATAVLRGKRVRWAWFEPTSGLFREAKAQ